MLTNLFQVSADRFSAVRGELQSAWLARMQLLLRRVQGKVLLLWFSDHEPPEDEQVQVDPSDCGDPMFITRTMVEDLTKNATQLIDVTTSQAAQEAGTDGMVFSELEALAARHVMGPKAHTEASAEIGGVLRDLIA